MNPRITLAASVFCMLVSACSDDLDRERLDISDLNQRIGTISSLKSVDGVVAETEIRNGPDDSKGNNAPSADSIEKIISSLTVGRTRGIGLPETRRSTLSNNLKIQSALIDPEIGSQLLLAEQAKFQSTFNTSITAERVVAPKTFPPPLTDEERVSISMAPSVNVPLRTGGSINLDWTLNTNRSSVPNELSQSATISSPGLEIQQPLLRGGGVAYNEASIVIAESNLGSERSQAQVEVINELVQSEISYWNLYRAWKMLQVNIGLYKTSRELLQNQRRETELMNSSVANVYNFEVSLAMSADTVLSSELSFREAVRDLKLTIQNPEIDMDSATTLVPTTEPRLIGYDFNAEKLVRFAIDNRADLIDLEYQQITRTLDVLMRENETLPQLDLLGSWNANGFASAFNSYQKANTDLWDGSQPDGWMLGMNLSVPLGNEIAIANLQAALLSRLQSIADLRQRRITVTAEVLDAIDELETGWNRILTTRFQVRAAERFYQSYKLLFERGEIPSSNLTQALAALSSAQIQEVQAEVDYQIKFADLAQATGCLLGHAGVDWASDLELERFEDPARYPPQRGVLPDSEDLDKFGPPLESLIEGDSDSKNVPDSVKERPDEDDPTPPMPAPKVD